MDKNSIKTEIINSLCSEKEISKIALFGSFVHEEKFNDIDIAIFENSDLDFITLNMKYRKKLRALSKEHPIDLIPIREGVESSFLVEIDKGEVIFEKRN